MDRRTFLRLGVGAAILPTLAKIRFPVKENMFKLGKAAASDQSVKLKLGDYLPKGRPLTPPKNFGHENLVSSWGMLKNDVAGDCVFAGAAHEHLIWSAEGGHATAFTDQGVIQAYSDVTGYDPAQTGPTGYNPTDQGTVVADALKYRRTHGMVDAFGKVHKIEAYAKLVPGNITELANATYLFSAVGVGLQLPEYAIDQFKNGEPWNIISGNYDNIGGHYVPILAKRNGYFACVSWGKLQLISPLFIKAFCDEAYALFDSEMLRSGKSLDGFDQAGLLRNLRALTA